MATISITNERLNNFALAGKAFTGNTPLSKLWFAADKITKIALKRLKAVEKEKQKKRREFAMKKDKGLYDLDAQGNFQFNDEGLNKLEEALLSIDEQTTELPVHIIPHGDYDEQALSFDMRTCFEGIVIPDIDYEKFDIDQFEEPKSNGVKKLAVDAWPSMTLLSFHNLW